MSDPLFTSFLLQQQLTISLVTLFFLKYNEKMFRIDIIEQNQHRSD